MTLAGSFSKADDTQPFPVEQGVYCDVYGTLVDSSYEPNRPLIHYLNTLYTAGIQVTIFSTDPTRIKRKTLSIGLHPDLAGLVHNKADYAEKLLETLIDDDPPPYLQAQTRWDPKKPELYQHIKAEIKRLSPPNPPHHPH